MHWEQISLWRKTWRIKFTYSQRMNGPENFNRKYFAYQECCSFVNVYLYMFCTRFVPRKQKYEEENYSSKRLKINKNKKTENILFPNQSKVSGKKVAKNILTYNAHLNVLEAAAKCDDQKMMMDIARKDFIARELKTHDKTVLHEKKKRQKNKI